MSSWVDLSIINSVLSGGVLLVMLSYAYLFYSALWKMVLRKEFDHYLEQNQLPPPSDELEYWRPMLKYRCIRGEQPIDIVVAGGVFGLRITESKP